MGTLHPALNADKSQQEPANGAEAAAAPNITPLVWWGLLCYIGHEMGRVLVWEQSMKRKYLNTCRLQVFHGISNHSRWVYVPTQKESAGFTLQLARAGEERGQHVPKEQPGWRKSICSSTSLHSSRESRWCLAELHSTCSSAGIRRWCAYTHQHHDFHRGGPARVG